MQSGTERRNASTPRVPLDLLVQLHHEDFEGAFDADSVDVALGGLSLRSDYLPEVGEKLQCSFECPTAEAVEVQGEVVWAHDGGTRTGEFGLRFDALEQHTRSAIEGLISHLDATVPGHSADDLHQSARQTSNNASSKHASSNNAPAFNVPTSTHLGQARLHLAGVATPIEAQVIERGDNILVAEQELPFLELGMSVAVEEAAAGSVGRLCSVDLRIDDGTPKLVLGVELFPKTETVSDDTNAEDSYGQKDSADATLRDFDAQSEDAQYLASGAELSHSQAVETSLVAAEAIESKALKSKVSESTALGEQTPAVDDIGELAAELGKTPLQQLVSRGKALSLVLSSKAQKFAPQLKTFGAKLKPGAVALWARTVALAQVIWSRSRPVMVSIWGRSRALAEVLWALVSSRLPQKRRRKTALVSTPATTQSAPRRQQKAVVADSPKVKGRVVVIGLLALGTIVAAIFAFSGGAEPETPDTEARLSTHHTTNDQKPAKSTTNASAGVAANPLATPQPSTTENSAQTGGQLGEPTFPSLHEASTRQAQAPIEEGASFGSDQVEGGRSSTIRLSQPVNQIRGQRQEDGFTLTVPGALALDPAGPIAAINPSVERAMILNRGDHSVLTVRFVAGRNPAYRVRAQGRSLEITIGR